MSVHMADGDFYFEGVGMTSALTFNLASFCTHFKRLSVHLIMY